MGLAIGIDLGTTNSVAAVDETGRVRVLPTCMYESVTPSVVSYRKAREANKTGQLLVGRAAVNNAKFSPDETIFSVKRLIGRTYDDPSVAEVRSRLPYKILPDESTPGIQLTLGKANYSPTEVSAMILRQVVQDAERALGKKVTHAVITVPAYFTTAQRTATRAAGAQAGLVVQKIVDEPTAAALAFGVEHTDEKHRVLVYDFGGGTFDISLIQMTQQHLTVLATSGDTAMGGDDMDREIVALIAQWCKERTGQDPLTDRRFLRDAIEAAEKTKRALSGQDAVEVIIPGGVRSPDGVLLDIELEVTRAEFERRIQPYVDRSMDLVREVLDKQQVVLEQISAVLMVGGTTAVPLVHRTVAALFGAEKVKRGVDPMHCVGLGAAILAARMTGLECPECKSENTEAEERCRKCGLPLREGGVISEVTARSLGIQATNRDGLNDLFATIIPRSTPYPLPRPIERQFYTTAERLIRVPVYEGEHQLASHNELQGVIEVSIPNDIPANTPVWVQFNYDKDRILTVAVRIPGRDDLTKLAELRPSTPSATIKREPERWKKDLDWAANNAERFLKECGELLDQSAINTAHRNIAMARRAYGNELVHEGERLTSALQTLVRGSGAASSIYWAEQAKEGIDPRETAAITQGIRELKEAHASGEQAREQQAISVLVRRVNRVLRARIGQSGANHKHSEHLLSMEPL